MDNIHREILQRKWVELGKDLEPVRLLKHMTEVLNSEDREKITAQPQTRTKSADIFLDMLPRRGGKAFHCFLKALEENQPHLAEMLRREEAVSTERVTSAVLRQRLSETNNELDRVKEQNLKIQSENEELKKLHEQILMTEDNLKRYFEEVLEKKAKYVPTDLPVVEPSYPPAVDENGNIIPSPDLEELKMELNRCYKRERELELKCYELQDKLKSLQSQPSNQVDRSTTPMHQAATEDSATCKKCENPGQKYIDLQNESTEEIQRMTNAMTEYEDNIKSLQKELSNCKQRMEESKALGQRFKINQTELTRVKAESESSKKRTETLKNKLATLKNTNKNQQQLLENMKKEIESAKNDKENSEKKMKDFRNMAGKVQKECDSLVIELEKWKSLSGKVFNFKKEFGNGIIHTLIKNAETRTQKFPFTAERSSDEHGHAMDIFNHSTGSHSGTKNEKHSWWQIDLGEEVLVFPNYYALRHGRDDGHGAIVNWKLEGSRDGNNWKVLREHKKERWLSKPGTSPFFHTGSWPIEGPIHAVRYLRIYQTNINAGKGHALYLSGIEVYGVLLHMCEGD